MKIQDTIAGSCKTAGKLFFLLIAFLGAITMVSCSESDGDEKDEFANWESRNDAYFSNIYTQAEAAINAGSQEWKIICVYSKDANSAKAKTDYIVAHVENVGTGTECPNFTDTVLVHYRGNLMPTASYTNGYQFDSSWQGEYNLKTMIPTGFNASNVVAGFTTALINMHKGDRWTVYIPYTLGYGSTASNSIPGYSTLRFDLTLMNFLRRGQTFPSYQ